MGFRKFAVQVLFLFHKNRHIIFIDAFFGIIIIFPDKAAVLSVFGNGRIPDNLGVLVNRIEIKDKDTAGIEKIFHQPEGFFQILCGKQVI